MSKITISVFKSSLQIETGKDIIVINAVVSVENNNSSYLIV